MTSQAMILDAIWVDSQYVVASEGWSSVDGDNWVTLDGTPVTGAKWEEVTIHLHGGPRDGVTVG